MRRVFITTLIISLFALVGCERDSGVDGLPVIDLGGMVNLSVPLEGGQAVIEYEIVNPVEGGEIFAESREDWIGGFNYDTPGQIVFNVEENITSDAEGNVTSEARTSIVTITYVYGENKSQSEPVHVNVIQTAYDYLTELTFMSGEYYGSQYGQNGEYNYFTILSDMEYLEGRQDGGTYYAFDIFTAAAPEDRGNPLPPAGTYVLGEKGATADMTFTPDYSQGIRTNDDGSSVFEVHFKEGTLNISYDGDVMNAEAVLTDVNDNKHYAVYKGVPVYSGGVSTLGRDLDIDAINGQAQYIAEYNGLMEVSVAFTDMEVDFFGFVTPPGSTLVVDMFMPYDESGNMATGTYTVSDTFEAFTVYPGEYVNYVGVTYVAGTYVDYIDENESTSTGLIVEGSMEVSGEPGNYTVECNFVTDDGSSVKCSYTGALPVLSIPGPYSTLTEDYTLDLEDAVGTAQFWGDYYGNGAANWLITLDQETGDGVQLEIMTESLDYNAELSTAVYKPSADRKNPKAGEYVIGYLEDSYLMGTNYMASDGGDYLSAYAPAIDGDLNITNNADGTYTVSFAFTDDLGHIWDGEWTGVLGFVKNAAPARNYTRAFCVPSDTVSIVESVALNRNNNAYKGENGSKSAKKTI